MTHRITSWEIKQRLGFGVQVEHSTGEIYKGNQVLIKAPKPASIPAATEFRVQVLNYKRQVVAEDTATVTVEELTFDFRATWAIEATRQEEVFEALFMGRVGGQWETFAEIPLKVQLVAGT